jgi:O-antigen biosynthesis protein WbqP
MNKLISFIIILLLFPILIISTLIIWIDDGSPIFFKQKRIGKNNKPFFIYKFRTMNNKTLDIPTHLIDKEKIIYTRLGPFLRKSSFDEIPQLINIIKGEMNFIGPRPSLYNQYDLISLRKDKGLDQLMPGITGWAQINGRDELSIEEKVKLDKHYLLNKSFAFDIKILFYTVFNVFKFSDISN